MRILIKVLLFPVAAALSLTTALFRFMCRFSRGLLSVASGLMFIAALLGLVLPVAKLPAANYAVMFALAFLISPFGLPKLADWLLGRLDGLNIAIRSI